MNRVFLVSILLLLFCGASSAQGDTLPITVHLSVDKEYYLRLPRSYFSYWLDKGDFHITTDSVDQKRYAIKVLINNRSTRPIFFWLMSCSWEDNFEINNNYIDFGEIGCDKNVPDLVKLGPGESRSFNAVLCKSIKFDHPCEHCIFGPQVEATRLGLILVDDIYKPKLDVFLGYELAMEDKSVWKIVWSNALFLLSKKEAAGR